MRTLVEGNKVGGLLIDTLLRAQSKVGVILGGDVTTGSGDSVNVRAGYCRRPGDKNPWQIASGTNYSLGSRDATYTKWGIIYTNTSSTGGSLGSVWGTAAANPVLPRLTSTAYLPLAAISLPQTGGGAFAIYDLTVPSPMTEEGFYDDFPYIDTTNRWTTSIGSGGYASAIAGTILELYSGTSTRTNIVSKVSAYTLSLEWKGDVVHLCARFKMPASATDVNCIGFSSMDTTPPIAAGNKYIMFSRGATYWDLTNYNGTNSLTVQSSVAYDTNWHTLDLLWLLDRTMAWIDGVFAVENTSYVPSKAYAERPFADVLYSGGVSTLDLEFIRVVSTFQ